MPSTGRTGGRMEQPPSPAWRDGAAAPLLVRGGKRSEAHDSMRRRVTQSSSTAAVSHARSLPPTEEQLGLVVSWPPHRRRRLDAAAASSSGLSERSSATFLSASTRTSQKPEAGTQGTPSSPLMVDVRTHTRTHTHTHTHPRTHTHTKIQNHKHANTRARLSLTPRLLSAARARRVLRMREGGQCHCHGAQ